MRARIDVSEIEATTKIRAKYLRALENEEWGLLPGPTFVKSFLRTYAQALGLDGKALVEEYRSSEEHPSEMPYEPRVSSPGRGRPGPSRPSRTYLAAVGGILAVIVLLIVLLAAGGGGGKKQSNTAAHAPTHAASGRSRGTAGASTSTDLVSLSLRASGPVFVCLLGDGGRELIRETELQAGETTRTYRARRFELKLGNSSVTTIVDGVPRTVNPSSQAIGYSITKAGGRRPLSQAQLPTCR